VIRKESELKEILVPNMRGGQGVGRQSQFFQPQDFSTPLAAFNVVTLDPGVSVGFHKHEGSEEVYWVLQGRGLAQDDDREVEMNPGDALLTQDQHAHSIANPGPGPLRLLTVLVNQVKK
jgi:mannose-6-phosphate isomerase-like protein (cupin superfamily)